MQLLALATVLGLSAGEKDPSKDVTQAVTRGVEILLELQEDHTGEEGPRAEWPYEGVYREQGEIPIGYRVGGTAICAWSLVDAPGWEAGSPRAAAVERALDFVLASLELPRMQPGFDRGYDVRGFRVREESGGWNDRVFPRSESFGTAMTLLAFTRPEHGLPPRWK